MVADNRGNARSGTVVIAQTIRACTRGGPEVGRLSLPLFLEGEPLRFPKDGRRRSH